MIKNYAYYELFASMSVPNPREVGYWVDLGADSLGNVIKFYDPQIKQWVKLTDASSEYAVSPRIGTNGNWFVDNRDTGIQASGENPYIGDNGNWYVFDPESNEYTDTEIVAKGKSAYDIAKDHGFVGTESEWLTSLKAGAAEAAARANQAANTANSAAARTNRLANNPPKIVNDLWAFYDEITNQYVVSEFPSRGKDSTTTISPRLLWGNEFDGSKDIAGNILIKDQFLIDNTVYSKLSIGENNAFYLENTRDYSNPSLPVSDAIIFAGNTDDVYCRIVMGTTGLYLLATDGSYGTSPNAMNMGIWFMSKVRPTWTNSDTRSEHQFTFDSDFDNNSIIHDNGVNIRVNPEWVKSETDLSNYLELTGGTMTGKLELAGQPVTDNDAVTKAYVDDLISELNNDALTFVGIVSTTEPTVDVRENNFWYNGELTDALPWSVKVYTSGSWVDREEAYNPIAMDLWSVNGTDAYYYLGQTWHQIDFNGSTFDLNKFVITDGVVSIKPGSIVDSDIAVNANISQGKVVGLSALSANVTTLQTGLNTTNTNVSKKLDKSTANSIVYTNSSTGVPSVTQFSKNAVADALVQRTTSNGIVVPEVVDTSKNHAIGAKQVMSLIGQVSGNQSLFDFLLNSSNTDSLSNLTLNHATIYCTASSDQTIGVLSKRFDNMSTQIYITNTSNAAITLSIPEDNSFISVSGKSVSIPAQSYTECSIMYDSNLLKYRIVFFYDETIEFNTLSEKLEEAETTITDLTTRIVALESALAGVNTLLDNLLREP